MRKLAALFIALVTLAALACGTAAAHARYVNPFADPRWEAGRIDMGMDWAPLHRLPVLAVGDAVILGSENHSGWPGNHLMWYQLTDGSNAGDVIYVAEHLTQLAAVGKVVRAGQQIAVAVPGYPYIEMGWADTYGSPRAYPCYKEGKATNSGREMARFLASLGATVGTLSTRVPTAPSGKRC
jgi:hypothetical protein